MDLRRRDAYAALDKEIRRELESLWERDADETEIELEYDERLARLGL